MMGSLQYKINHAAINSNEPDLVVMGINFPGNSSFQLLKEMKVSSPRTVVIVLSFRLDEFILDQCIDLGADFIFDKYYEFEKVPVIINAIAQNNYHLKP